MQIFHVSKYITVPLVAIAIWVLVVKGTYNIAERIFLIFSFALLSYIVSALLSHPNWGEIGTSIVRPDFFSNDTACCHCFLCMRGIWI